MMQLVSMIPNTTANDVLVRLPKEEHDSVCNYNSFYNRRNVIFSFNITLSTSITTEPNRTVAFADVHTIDNSVSDAKIILAVLPEMRELHMGTALVKQCLRKCKEFGINKLIAEVPITDSIAVLFFNTIFNIDRHKSNKDYFVFYKYINDIEPCD